MNLLSIKRIPTLLVSRFTPKTNPYSASYVRIGAPSQLPHNSLLSPRCGCSFSKRTFWHFIRSLTPSKLKIADRMPESYTLIYMMGMHRYLLSIQIFCTAAMLVVGTLMVVNSFNWKNSSKDNTEQVQLDNETIFFVTMFTVFYAVLQIMLMKLPVRIYNDIKREKYIFLFYGKFPLTMKQLKCQTKDVIKLEESGLLPWRDSRYEIINKQQIIMFENCFRKPADLNIMLGYQKAPVDYD